MKRKLKKGKTERNITLFGRFIPNISVRKIFKCHLVNLWQILWQGFAASKGFRNINLSCFCRPAQKGISGHLVFMSRQLQIWWIFSLSLCWPICSQLCLVIVSKGYLSQQARLFLNLSKFMTVPVLGCNVMILFGSETSHQANILPFPISPNKPWHYQTKSVQ